jgi:AcrR family transcriptional regulator
MSSERVDGRTLRFQHRRPELLAAATEYVLDRGIADLSLRPVAQSLGVTHATLLRHFSSKDELIKCVVEKIRTDLIAQVNQPISRSGPTASNAAFPYSPATSGSATFRARVTTLAKISSRRAGRSTSDGAPVSARCRVPSKSPRIERSTAGAISGATQTGTPTEDVTETEHEGQAGNSRHDRSHCPNDRCRV